MLQQKFISPLASSPGQRVSVAPIDHSSLGPPRASRFSLSANRRRNSQRRPIAISSAQKCNNADTLHVTADRSPERAIPQAPHSRNDNVQTIRNSGTASSSESQSSLPRPRFQIVEYTLIVLYPAASPSTARKLCMYQQLAAGPRDLRIQRVVRSVTIVKHRFPDESKST